MLKGGRLYDPLDASVKNLRTTSASETWSGEYREAAFAAVDVARDGKSMRLRFNTANGEIGLCVTPDNLSGMITLLLCAEAQGYKKADIPDAIRPLVTSDVGVSVCQDGKHLTITMILPGDRGRIGFQVDPKIAQGLMRLLAKDLAGTSLLRTPH